MEYHYQFADIGFQVRGSQKELYTNHGVLTPFFVDGVLDNPYILSVALKEELTSPSGICLYHDTGKQIFQQDSCVVRYLGNPGANHMRICQQGRSSQIECLRSAYPAGITPKTILNAMEAEHRIVQHHGVILHASFICVEGKAILFTAPSGTGKSTQASLWCNERNASLINGDRAAIIVENDHIFACGIPFSGSSGVSKSAKLPLTAIVYLSQAKENICDELTGLKAFRKVWEGCSVNVWDKNDVSVASDTVMKIVEKVSVFHFACRPDREAVDVLYATLSDRRCL